ncbi:hypothetical protein EJ06DRAFT_582166 [Trichodelitschia bisporula]|uniref:Uncharacterized protein n=1 Tax=Trichodelitschia bisporula TaxID=703511 RepID=A0A6G1HW69_9PEZI|nr:hypothetical protein EJ06DRAFT_582166 [Trichodelitschia bisporula]
MADVKTAPSSSSFNPLSTPLRFIALYLTSLFSFDAYAAARNSPYSVPLSVRPERAPSALAGQRWHRGEGEGVGFRMDPGAPEPKSKPTGGGGRVPVPFLGGGCGSCG